MPTARAARVRAARALCALAFAGATGFANAAELIVSAAASLTNAFRDVAAAFEKAHPGTQVRLNFASSGALLQQIARGAPVDVFASADEETMNDAERQRLVKAGTRLDFARNALVVVVPRDAARSPGSLAELAGPAYARVAAGTPASVPAGRYANGALEQARLWSAVAPKLIGAQSVRQVLDYVARGEVDAGFVYATDAASMPDKVKVAFTVPTTTPLRYPVAVVEASSEGEAAQAFVSFIASPSTRAILGRYGFDKP